MTQTKYAFISPYPRLLKISYQKLISIAAVILAALWITYILNVHYTNFNFFQINVSIAYPEYNEIERKTIETNKKCFELATNLEKIILFPDVLEHQIKPTPGKSIFFHVTTCGMNGSVILNARQACAIESVARLNPTRLIFVLFASPVGFESNETVSPIIKSLQSYPNIHFRRLDIVKYSIGTPGETWIRTDRIYLSKFIVAHMADYLRFLTLYKFGGIYFDLDVIVLKNLDEMPPNFGGSEDGYWTAIGAMGFEADNVGHTIIEMVSRENIETYKPNEWAASGVGAMTRVVQKTCQTTKKLEVKPEFCWGFKLYSPNVFYPIHWSIWRNLFSLDPKIVNETLSLAKDSITVHAWNKITANSIIDKSKPKTAYGTLAEMNCPGVFDVSGRYF